MIDFDKEEFLQRLDIRLITLSGMMSYLEKNIASALCDRKQFRDVEKRIDEARQHFHDYLFATDKEIREKFEQLKKQMSEDLKND